MFTRKPKQQEEVALEEPIHKITAFSMRVGFKGGGHYLIDGQVIKYEADIRRMLSVQARALRDAGFEVDVELLTTGTAKL